MVLEHRTLRPRGVGVRHALEGQGEALDDHIVDRDLEERLALLAEAGTLVDLLAQREERVDLAVEGQVEVRDDLGGVGQAPGDGLAHAVVRHFRVAAGLEERLDRRVRQGRGCGRRCQARAPRFACLGRFGLRPGFFGLADVALDDAAMRTRAFDQGHVEPGLLGDPASQRGCEYATAGGFRATSFWPGARMLFARQQDVCFRRV